MKRKFKEWDIYPIFKQIIFQIGTYQKHIVQKTKIMNLFYAKIIMHVFFNNSIF